MEDCNFHMLVWEERLGWDGERLQNGLIATLGIRCGKKSKEAKVHLGTVPHLGLPSLSAAFFELQWWENTLSWWNVTESSWGDFLSLWLWRFSGSTHVRARTAIHICLTFAYFAWLNFKLFFKMLAALDWAVDDEGGSNPGLMRAVRKQSWTYCLLPVFTEWHCD